MRARKQAPTEPGFRVAEHLIEGARQFLTIRPGDPLWSVPEAARDLEVPERFELSRTFVRLEPPNDASDAAIEWVTKRAYAAGAVCVVVVPRRRSAVVTPAREKKPHARARDVVMQMVGEANFPDREALRDLCDRVMAGRGI